MWLTKFNLQLAPGNTNSLLWWKMLKSKSWGDGWRICWNVNICLALWPLSRCGVEVMVTLWESVPRDSSLLLTRYLSSPDMESSTPSLDVLSWLRINCICLVLVENCCGWLVTAQGSRAQQSRLVVREGPGLDMRTHDQEHFTQMPLKIQLIEAIQSKKGNHWKMWKVWIWMLWLIMTCPGGAALPWLRQAAQCARVRALRPHLLTSCQVTSRNVSWTESSAKTSYQQVRGEEAARMGSDEGGKMDTWWPRQEHCDN